ncbi:MAG: glutamine amidotransferase [Kiritimatiellia bacterium]
MFSFYPILPPWLIILMLAFSGSVVVWSYRHRNPAVELWQHRLLLALRMVTLALILMMLLCPGRMTEERNVEKSHIVLLIDKSASMGVKDLSARESRFERALRFLEENRFKRLSDYPFTSYSFDNQVKKHDSPGVLDGLKAGGGTDLKQAVDRIDKDIGLNRTSALVLLSDGLDYSGFRGSSVSMPIMSVRMGTDMSEVKDLGIEPFKCPAKVSEGEEIVLEIPVMLQGYSREQESRFEVDVDEKPVHSLDLTLGSGRLHTEKVKISLKGTGIHIISVDCEDLPDEVSHLNNRRELAVEVVKAKEEVAVYFPVLNNSFRPLLREFTKDDTSVFTAVYKVSEGNYRLRGTRINRIFKDGLPPKSGMLANVTCFVLGSHNKDVLSAAEALLLEQYVRKGGTLVCLAGSDSFGELPSGSPMHRLLPVVTMEKSYESGTFRVETGKSFDDAFAGQINEIIRSNNDSAAFMLSGINVVKDVKANARVMLWAVDERRQPLVVYHSYGRGKVVALLSNTFHQWGAPDRRDENFSRFWRQLIAFSRNPDEDADLLKVALSKNELAAGESVAITATARHPSAGGETNAPALTVKADLFASGSDTPKSTLELERKTGCYMGSLPGLDAGRYVLRVTSQDGREILRTRYKFLLVGDVLRENTRIRCDRENFRAFSSEKNIFEPDEAERLQDVLREAVRKNIVHRESFLIFETPWFFIAVVILLLTEWILRRRFNLF